MLQSNQYYKKLWVLFSFSMPIFFQAGTILDVQEEINTALRNHEAIDYFKIEQIIQEKIDAHATDDVDAIEKLLLEFKQQLAQKSCLSNQWFEILGDIAKAGTYLTSYATLFTISPLVGLYLGQSFEELIDPNFLATSSWRTPEHYFKSKQAVVGLSVGTLVAGAITTALLRFIEIKAYNISSHYKQGTRNKKTINILLKYLYFQKGLAQGKKSR